MVPPFLAGPLESTNMEEMLTAPNLPGPENVRPGNPKLQLIVLVVACVLFGLSVLFGIAAGFSAGKSKATFDSVSAVNKALQYYKQDQGRFPTADQFYNQRILVPNYMDTVPEPQDLSGGCAKYTEFIYAQTAPSNYVLEFCLTSAAGGLGKGLHAFTEKGLQ